jgi:hypothetical protein
VHEQLPVAALSLGQPLAPGAPAGMDPGKTQSSVENAILGYSPDNAYFQGASYP